jgi:hypothetical protein
MCAIHYFLFAHFLPARALYFASSQWDMFLKDHLYPGDLTGIASMSSGPASPVAFMLFPMHIATEPLLLSATLQPFWPTVAQEFQGMDLTLLHVHRKPAGLKLFTFCGEAATTVRTYNVVNASP